MLPRVHPPGRWTTELPCASFLDFFLGSGRFQEWLKSSAVLVLDLVRGAVLEFGMKALIVPPPHPFEGCEFDLLDGAPLARVKHRIRSPNEAQAESTLVHGDVALDLLARRVTAAGIEQDLTALEFTMLEFFLRHPCQVLSREQLLSRVWGLGHDPASNVVDVYIRYLGQKLGNDLIHKVRGMSYRFG